MRFLLACLLALAAGLVTVPARAVDLAGIEVAGALKGAWVVGK